MTPHVPAEVEWPVMFALRRYHSKGQNSVTRLLHYWADVSRAWGFRVCILHMPRGQQSQYWCMQARG